MRRDLVETLGAVARLERTGWGDAGRARLRLARLRRFGRAWGTLRVEFGLTAAVNYGDAGLFGSLGKIPAARWGFARC